jgi:hypothetical protein
MTNSGRILTKCMMLVVLALPLMGNQKCEMPERKLKKSVIIGRVQSRTFTLPSGKQFDFENVINAQWEDVVNEHPEFTTRMNVSSAAYNSDLDLLTQWSEEGEIVTESQNVPDCVVDIPQYYLEGAAPSFEFVAGGGIRFGYDFTSGDLAGARLEGAVHVDLAQLHVNLEGRDYLSRTFIAGGEANGNHTKTKIDATLDLDNLIINPELYKETPIGKVSRKGLEKALDDLSGEVNERDEWSARVYQASYSPNGYLYVTINAGSKAGIEEGDKFAIYNLDHLWEDENKPCNSRYLGNVTNPGYPVAKIEILGKPAYDYARGIVYQDSEFVIKRGALVVVEELKQPEPQKKRKK